MRPPVGQKPSCHLSIVRLTRHAARWTLATHARQEAPGCARTGLCRASGVAPSLQVAARALQFVIARITCASCMGMEHPHRTQLVRPFLEYALLYSLCLCVHFAYAPFRCVDPSYPSREVQQGVARGRPDVGRGGACGTSRPDVGLEGSDSDETCAGPGSTFGERRHRGTAARPCGRASARRLSARTGSRVACTGTSGGDRMRLPCRRRRRPLGGIDGIEPRVGARSEDLPRRPSASQPRSSGSRGGLAGSTSSRRRQWLSVGAALCSGRPLQVTRGLAWLVQTPILAAVGPISTADDKLSVAFRQIWGLVPSNSLA